MAPQFTAAEAVPALLTQYGGRLYRIGVRFCGDPDEAQDLVQDVFLTVYRKWDQFAGRSDPGTWLYTIAARACQRRHRKRAGEPHRLVALDDLLASQSDPIVDVDAIGPLDRLLRREAIDAVHQAIATVPVSLRLPFVLAEIAQLPLREIGRILGVKAATVKTRVHRARLVVRKALLSQLPLRSGTRVDHARQICLDLLTAKQEALDRGVSFDVPPGELCARCASLFATLDLTQAACRTFQEDDLPEPVRRVVLDEVTACRDRRRRPDAEAVSRGTTRRSRASHTMSR